MIKTEDLVVHKESEKRKLTRKMLMNLWSWWADFVTVCHLALPPSQKEMNSGGGGLLPVPANDNTNSTLTLQISFSCSSDILRTGNNRMAYYLVKVWVGIPPIRQKLRRNFGSNDTVQLLFMTCWVSRSHHS